MGANNSRSSRHAAAAREAERAAKALAAAQLRRGAYAPALTVRDVASRGRSHRILGRVTGREHHLFSDLEEATFLLLDWSGALIDIREQFALPLGATVAIAAELSVRHPQPPRATAPTPVTTDFLVTLAVPWSAQVGGGDTAAAVALLGAGRPTPAASGPGSQPPAPPLRLTGRDWSSGYKSRQLLAVACKPSGELTRRRVLEKLEIERRYWATQGVPWLLVTERDLPRGRVANLRWLHGAWRVEGLPLPAERVPAVCAELAQRITGRPSTPLAYLCLEMDAALGLRPGDCLAVVKHALATGLWAVDLGEPIDPLRPLALVRPGPRGR